MITRFGRPGAVTRGPNQFCRLILRTITRGRARSLHKTSPAVANQLNNFVSGRQTARLFLGIDFLLFDKNV